MKFTYLFLSNSFNHLMFKKFFTILTLKDNEHSLIQSQTTKEILLKKVPGNPHLDRKLLQRFFQITCIHTTINSSFCIWNNVFRLSPNSALSSLDYKVADLQKKYNKIRYRAGKKAEYLSILKSEVNKMESETCETREITKEEQRQRFLENEIHKTSLKMMEADMVRKKYDIILDMLKQERMGYITQIESLENICKGQSKDVSRLEGEYKEACEFRDEARADLKEKEVDYASEGKDREKSLIETKRAMKDRKDLFKSVDHLLMGSVASSKHDGSSNMSDSMMREDLGDGKSEMDKGQYAAFEEAFSRMKKAAGVSEVDEVIKRFLTQGKTSDILGDQMSKAENDVRILGQSKENLQSEWEVVRYLK